MSDAMYLIDALRKWCDVDVIENTDIYEWANEALEDFEAVLRRFDADLAAGRVPVIVDRETRDALDSEHVDDEHYDNVRVPLYCGRCRIVDAYDAATRDTSRST